MESRGRGICALCQTAAENSYSGQGPTSLQPRDSQGCQLAESLEAVRETPGQIPARQVPGIRLHRPSCGYESTDVVQFSSTQEAIYRAGPTSQFRILYVACAGGYGLDHALSRIS